MSELTTFTAIEITSPEVVNMMAAFDPTLYELDYEKDLNRNFFVLHFPEKGTYAIVKVDNFYDNFDHIMIGDVKIKTRLFIKK